MGSSLGLIPRFESLFEQRLVGGVMIWDEGLGMLHV